MKTLLIVPATLLDTARELGQTKTKSETVVRALEVYVQSLRQQRLLQRIGKGFGMTPRRLRKTRELS